MAPSSPKCRSQRGSAMIISLIFLLMMTLISTAAMRSSTMQARMAGNARDVNVAFQAAEAALREAEQNLLDNTETLPDFADAGGYYLMNSPNRPIWVGANTTNGNGFLTYARDLPGTSARPQYFIEELPLVVSCAPGEPCEDALRRFRITARGFGGAQDTVVVLSTTYRSR